MIPAVACALLTLGVAAYIFFPEKKVTAQREKTRLEYLEEQKAALYENLRDLRFERASGKYSDAEFGAELAALEEEASVVVGEIETLERRSALRRRA